MFFVDSFPSMFILLELCSLEPVLSRKYPIAVEISLSSPPEERDFYRILPRENRFFLSEYAQAYSIQM